MAYGGTVELVDGIKPKNNGTWPLVNAHDVYVDDENRLDNALSGIDDKVDEALDNAVRVDKAQDFTDEQKEQALENIGGASINEIIDLKGKLIPRNCGFFNSEIVSGAPNDLYIRDDIVWEQGLWDSTKETDNPNWIKCALIDGNFVLHNNDDAYGYIVGEFDSSGIFIRYRGATTLINTEWFYVPDVSPNKIRLRQRHMIEVNHALLPENATVEIYRPTDTNLNGLEYKSATVIESYGTSLADAAGYGNYITNARASYWTDEPFGGIFINVQYTETYDLQVMFRLDGNDIAYRIINRISKAVYQDWVRTSTQIDICLKYGLITDPTVYEGIFCNVVGKNIISNLAFSQWSDIPFGGCAFNFRYTGNYDMQIIFALDSKNIAYRYVNRTTKEPFNEWQILINNNLKGKKAAIIGDSRSSYQGTVPTGNAYYYPKTSGAILTQLSDMWWKKTLDYFGMTLTVNDSYSGGYVANKDSGDGANILSSDISIGNLGNEVPDIVMIYAGVNDWNGNAVSIGEYDGTGVFPSVNTTFREALAILISKVQNKFPSADIWLCTNPYCCPAGTGSTASSMPVPKAGNNGTSLDKFNTAIIEIGKMFGCGIIDFARCGTNYKNIVSYTGDYDTDNGLHYNTAGHALLANVAIRTLDKYYN